ncbi:hypothetical protein [Streptomyces sp. NPDC056853]|uniref:hypothetical protein n=1 Tax=Streptomyces sp. NPDC056853 TaxID=3345958 RepID=UPI00369EA6EA
MDDTTTTRAAQPCGRDKVRRISFYDVKVTLAAVPTPNYGPFAYTARPRSAEGNPRERRGALPARPRREPVAHTCVDMPCAPTGPSVPATRSRSSRAVLGAELVNGGTVRIQGACQQHGVPGLRRTRPGTPRDYNIMSVPASEAGEVTAVAAAGAREVRSGAPRAPLALVRCW